MSGEKRNGRKCAKRDGMKRNQKREERERSILSVKSNRKLYPATN
jgi:hypothetical protein